MSEQWEKVIEHEIQFCLRANEYESEIYELLQENELNIQWPVTNFDTEQGRVYLHCPSTEDQAIRRIEKKESLNALLKIATKRVERFVRAFQQLNEKEKDIITYTYFEPMQDREFKFVMGIDQFKDIPKVRQHVLRKLFRIYEKERADKHKEFAQTLKEEREKKAEALRKELAKGRGGEGR